MNTYKGPRLRTLEAFRIPNFRPFWSSGTTSYVNRWMEITVTAWLVLELTGSPFQVALIGFYKWFPMLILGPLTGSISDRFDRKRLLMTTVFVNCLTSAVIATLMLRHEIQVWHLAVGTLLVGTMWSFDYPARRPLLMDMVGKSRLANAIALDSGSLTGSKMLGPFVAGLLIDKAGPGWVFVLISILYGVGFILLAMVKVAPEKRSVVREPILKNMSEGIKYAMKDPAISRVLLITVAMNLMLFPYAQFVPLFAKEVLHVGPTLMGLLLSADGAGAFIGAIVVASITVPKRHYGRIIMAGSVGSLLLLLLFSLSSVYHISFMMLLLMGMSLSGFGTMQSLIILVSSSEEMRGRGMGLLGLAIGVSPFGILFMGYLADKLGGPAAVTISSSIGLVFMIAIAVFSPQFWRPRRIEEETKPRGTL